MKIGKFLFSRFSRWTVIGHRSHYGQFVSIDTREGFSVGYIKVEDGRPELFSPMEPPLALVGLPKEVFSEFLKSTMARRVGIRSPYRERRGAPHLTSAPFKRRDLEPKAEREESGFPEHYY